MSGAKSGTKSESTTPSVQGWASLEEDIRRRAGDIEASRRLPDDLAAGMATAGLFRMLVPRRYGGGQVHPGEMFDAIRATSRADGAVGWCHMIGATTGLLAASLPEVEAQHIYGDRPLVITAGVTAPLGRATPVEGGYRISGRWPFGSACQVADWICGGCVVTQDDAPATDGGTPQIILALFPREQVTVHDTWHTAGLCGTGSNDIEVRDVRVPAGRCTSLAAAPVVDEALYRFPLLGLLAVGVSAVTVGIAERAVEELLALAGGKTPTGSRRTLAQRAGTQQAMARATALVESAAAYLHDTIQRAWSQAERQHALDTAARGALRLAATHAAWSAAEAVNLMYHAGGGSSIYRDSALQRCFRDVHVATQHIMVAQPTWEVTGRVLLGIDAGTPL